MAKRKRLMPHAMASDMPADLETKSMPHYPLRAAPTIRASRPPIAQVAGDAGSQAALEEVAAELHTARQQCRLVLALPLDTIKQDHLVRDMLELDTDDMAVLTATLRARGQQTPIEVVELGQKTYG